MGVTSIIFKMLGMALLGGLAYLSYFQFYSIKYYHTRDFHSKHDRHETMHMIFEDFDVIRRNKADIMEFERSWYEKVSKDDLPLKGKTVVLTGATKGLGRGMAAHLAAFGANLVLPCRRCNFDEFKTQVREDAQRVYEIWKPMDAKKTKLTHNIDIQVFDADLADLDRIDAFVEWYKKSNIPKADVFISNAGLVSMQPVLTKQGFESTFGVNFLAASYLAEQLLRHDLIKGNILSVSSEDHRAGGTVEETLKEQKVKFGQPWGVGLLDAMERYYYSKLLQTTYFLTLSRKYPKVPIIDICPGPIASDIAQGAKWPLNVIVKFFLDRLFVTIEQGAIPVLRLALDKKFANVTNKHFQLAEERPARDDATDLDTQEKIYAWTQELFRTRRPPA